MKTLIHVYRDGKYVVAVDLFTNVADQGMTEKEAIENLKRGLEGHYKALLGLIPRDKTKLLEINVPYAETTDIIS